MDVLNVFDDILKEFIVKYHSLLFVDSNNIEGGHIDAPEESDLWNILSILSFTKELLRQSYGKHIYSSTEVSCNFCTKTVEYVLNSLDAAYRSW